MKKFLITAALVLSCALTVVPRASAQSGSFTFTGVPVGPLNPGDSFTVQMSLQVVTGGTVTDLSGLSYWFAQTSPTSGFGFQLTSRNIGASLFTDLQSPGLQIPQIMDPINRNPNGTQTSTDLGALINGAFPGQPTGTYFIAALTFQVLPTAGPGTYTLRSTTSAVPGVGGRISVWNDSEGDTSPIAASGFSFTTLAVPEPSSVVLFAVGVMGAGLAVFGRGLRRI